MAINQVLEGDCLELLRALPDNSVDSFVSDPPAGIAFMGKKWDADKGGRKQWCAYMEERFTEALRVCKPGSHGLVWALPRTSHWTATALEDAGWELKDVITHHFGSGFPKSMNIGKAIDKMRGLKREVVGNYCHPDGGRRPNSRRTTGNTYGNHSGALETPITAPASPEAKQWDGFGTALKPASEHWILVRKPVEGTIAGNVLEHGVGALNIDGCRVVTSEIGRQRDKAPERMTGGSTGLGASNELGRFPANLLLSHSHNCEGSGCADDCPVRVLDEQTGVMKSGTCYEPKDGRLNHSSFRKGGGGSQYLGRTVGYKDDGGASRFFSNFRYYPKASTSDRSHKGQVQNNHPTVKNRELMRWLCRLVTPPGGTVLDCFAGSGSTAIACLEEGFNYILFEQDKESVQTARDRVAVWLRENRGEVATESTRVQWLQRQTQAKPEPNPQLSLFDLAG